jgi:hypothetical protein
MLAAVAAVIIVAFVVTTWLLAIASGANPGTDRANSRLDAVRTGLAAGAGAGAAVGLMLAFRRQYHQEVATELTDRDATERRITELYTKAVEQLGNDKAPVRLDPNDWSREVGDPRYILDLLARVVTVSVETRRIVDGLPTLALG